VQPLQRPRPGAGWEVGGEEGVRERRAGVGVPRGGVDGGGVGFRQVAKRPKPPQIANISTEACHEALSCALWLLAPLPRSARAPAPSRTATVAFVEWLVSGDRVDRAVAHAPFSPDATMVVSSL